MNNKEKIYIYNDDISFRFCSLHNQEKNRTYGDCSNFYETEENFVRYYNCCQHGIHFHCTKHPDQELNVPPNLSVYELECPKCGEKIKVDDFEELIKKCIRIYNAPKFKDAKLIRLDDWYIPEIKKKVELPSDYWMNINVKTDKDNDTIIILYVGKKNSNDKVQYFIKPEKLQLTTDHNDLDPATIISKIEVTLKDRKIIQEYDKDNTV